MTLYIVLTFDDLTPDMLTVSDILKSAGARGTFFINTAAITSENEEGIVKELAESHEIGSHSHSHPDLTKLSTEMVYGELELSKQILERIVKREVKSFAYPYGAHNNIVVEAVRKCGYTVARTTIVEPPTTTVEDFLRLPVVFHDFLHLNKEAVENLLKKLLKERYTQTTLEHLWRQVAENPVKALNTLLELFKDWEPEEDALAIILLHPWKVRELNAWRELEQAITTAKAIGKIATLEEARKTFAAKQNNRKLELRR